MSLPTTHPSSSTNDLIIVNGNPSTTYEQQSMLTTKPQSHNNNNDSMNTKNIETSSATSTTDSSSSSSLSIPFLSAEQIRIGLLIALNISSVVGIVAVNKQIFRYPGFKFPSSLMCMHFIVTYFFILLLQKLGQFESKFVERKHYMKLGMARVGSVAMVNLSLVYNDVGTYQLMKFLVIFITCVLEYLFYRKVYSTPVYMILLGTVFSISMATIHSLHPSPLGVGFGLLGAFGTAYHQILNKFVQTEHKLSALQLLHGEAPWSAMWCFVFASLTEPVAEILTFPWTTQLLGLVALSCFAAFCVNASVYMIIGKTSPVTYSFLGHVKAVLVFAVGITLFGDKFSTSQAFWMFMAFTMIVSYSQFSQQTSPPKIVKASEQDDEDGITSSPEKPPIVAEATK